MNTKPLLIAAIVGATILAACGPASDSADEQAAVQADSMPESQTSATGLQADYRMIAIEQLQTAEQVTQACEAEVSALESAIVSLEQFTLQPSVDNYLQALNSQFVSLSNMEGHTSTLAATHPDEAVRDASDACGQSLSSMQSNLTLSRPIYERVSQVDLSGSDSETQRFVEKLLLTFRLSGVDKDEKTRARVKELNDEITAIGQEFDRNIVDDVRYLELSSVDQLAGLPEDYIAAHQAGEDGLIKISTQYPDLFPFFTYSDSDDLRFELSMLSSNRAYPQNEELLQKLLKARYELAQQLGFKNYAELITANKMVGSPERVEQFLDELTGYTEEAQDRDYQVLLTRLRQDQPDAQRVELWQRAYLNEKVRKEQFEVDSKEVREYFNYKATRDGILTLVQDIFGLTITPWATHTWHEDVEAYELRDGEKLIGRFYLDMHPREGKYQHAAAFPLQNGISGEQLPLVTLLCNFPRGDELMQHTQVVTFLHEFGHLIHFLLAGDHNWFNISGISTEWDFVEAPSQMLQEWVWDYDTISTFAHNSKGEPIPESLLDKMIAARDFGLGMGTRRQLSFAALSLNLYNRDPEGLDLKTMTDDMTRKYTKFEPLEDGHFFAAFGHLNGYSAIYYTYQWSLAIATDIFTRFEEDGLRNVETAGEYRDKILGQGGAKPAAELVTDFLGRDISFKPYADRLSGAAKEKIESQTSE
jgi:thimet oligopeptidase